MIERIKYYRDGARVRRYHTLDLLVGETVGHHSCNVALIVSAIVPYPSANLLLAALKHDLAEQHTGDVPATAKWANPLLKRLLDRVEGQHVEEHDEHVLTLAEKQALKQADMLDLCFKCLEEMAMGNASMERVLQNGMQWLNDNDPLPTTFTLIKEIANEHYRQQQASRGAALQDPHPTLGLRPRQRLGLLPGTDYQVRLPVEAQERGSGFAEGSALPREVHRAGQGAG